MTRLDCEYHLRPGEGEFRIGIDRWRGPVDLMAVPPHGHGWSYGKLLFNALFPLGSELLREYQKAEREARARNEGCASVCTWTQTRREGAGPALGGDLRS